MMTPTPAETDRLILGIVLPALGTGYSAEEYRKWEDDVQTYYDRVAELRRQLHAAVPKDMPHWVNSAAYWAWQGAVTDANVWRTGTRAGRRKKEDEPCPEES